MRTLLVHARKRCKDLKSSRCAHCWVTVAGCACRYNVQTAASWDMTSSTADTSSFASRLGIQTAYLLTNVEELCALCSPVSCTLLAKQSCHHSAGF